MRVSAILFFIILIYGIFFLWPIKRKVYKKHGRILSNAQILKLATEGDKDALALKKKTKYFLFLGIAFALLFILEKYKLISIFI